ncbi:MAG: methionyl-tRNA formyltransferase [Mobilitalea sp.]
MRILFMGTPDFAATILDRLIKEEHEIIGVVTQPDKQKGRGKEVSYSAVKEVALSHNLPVYQPVKVREPEFLEKLKEMDPEVIIVAAFGQILPKALLDIPPFGCINVHASLLPKYRGAAPIQYSILEGEKETGITIMYMDVGIDTGDMIIQEKLTIDQEETGGSLFNKMADLGAELMARALKSIKDGSAVRTPQNNEEATYVKIIDKQMGRIDFTQSAVKIERMIRGLNPWPSAFTMLEGKTLKIWLAKVESFEDNKELKAETLEPGEIIEIRKDAIVVKTGDGLLVIRELQLEGKKRMTAESFLRGYQLKTGLKLG